VSVGAGGEEAKDGGRRQIRRMLRRRAARGRAAPLRADCHRGLRFLGSKRQHHYKMGYYAVDS
jgi:hypothetical protein